jgi:hypothetical protein
LIFSWSERASELLGLGSEFLKRVRLHAGIIHAPMCDTIW